MRPLLAARSAAALSLREPQRLEPVSLRSPVGPSPEDEWAAWASWALDGAGARPPATGSASPPGPLGAPRGAAAPLQKGLAPGGLAGLERELQSTKLSCSQQLVGLHNVASQLRLQVEMLHGLQSPVAGGGGGARAPQRSLPRCRATSPLRAAGGAREAAANSPSPAAAFAKASDGTVAVAAAGAPGSPVGPAARVSDRQVSPGRPEAPRRLPQLLDPVAEAPRSPGAAATGRSGARSLSQELTAGQWSGEEKERYVQGLMRPYLAGEDGLIQLFVDVFCSTPLPAPWLPCRDSQDRVVFLNAQTGDTAWYSPLDGVMKEIAMICRAFLQLPPAQRNLCISSLQEQWDSEITQELGQWTQAQDKMSGQRYYYHQATKNAMWQPPGEVLLPAHYFRMRLTEMFRHQGLPEATAAPARSATTSLPSPALVPDCDAARRSAAGTAGEGAAADGACDGGAHSARLQAQRSLLRRADSSSSGR